MIRIGISIKIVMNYSLQFLKNITEHMTNCLILTYSKVTHKIYILIHFDGHSHLGVKDEYTLKVFFFFSHIAYSSILTIYLKPTQKVALKKLLSSL